LWGPWNWNSARGGALECKDRILNVVYVSICL
jgi:hypothetical protein